MRVYLETFGCQMNRLDSELARSSLRAAGHEIVPDRKRAELVLYNTCSVRDHAEQKVFSRLGADAQRKADGKKLIVGVLGCMVQRLGRSLLRTHPQVDLLCSPGQLPRLSELIDQAACGATCVALDPPRTARAEAGNPAPTDELDLSRDPRDGESSAQAYVRVMRGCDMFCSYCIVPYVRGPQRSRAPERIVEEVRRLVEAGRSEITLLGQIVNAYEWSAGGRTVRLADLLERLSPTPGLRRLRFLTNHPSPFETDILQAMRDLPNVCEYLHCPAQSGSDSVLKRMGRRYTRAQYDELIDRARGIVPNLTVAGDFIVGFPGETEAEHAASAELIRRSGYKNSFIFKYSPRPGTPAARRFTDDVPRDVKRRRNNELLAVQEQVSRAHHEAFVGQQVEVLVTGPSPRVEKQTRPPTGHRMQLTGRTRGDHIVVFDGPASLIGRYVDVRIASAEALVLFGRPVEAGSVRL